MVLMFILFLIINVKLGLLFGYFGYLIASKYHQGKSAVICGALGFLLTATIVGGITVIAGAGAASVLELFWPMPLIAGLHAYSLTTNFWKWLTAGLEDSQQSWHSSHRGGYRSSSYRQRPDHHSDID